MNYIVAAVIFTALGLSYHAIYRWWFAHLTNLAASHGVRGRRTLAAIHFIGTVALVIAMLLASLVVLFRFFPINGAVVLVGILAAGVPNIVWWQRRWPSLQAFGYGIQSKHHT